MADFKNKNHNNKSYLERRRHQRKNAECSLIWKEDNRDFKSAEDVFKSFFRVDKDVKNRYISSSDSSDSSFSSSEEDSKSSRDIPNELLRKKRGYEDNQDKNLIEELESEGFVDESVGPQPIRVELDKKDEKKFYAGTDLNQSEKEAFSKYVQDGKRIPRRGEVGLTSDEIERYESLGYVMSGSRHKKMNAARIKKEAQVYTAEEKRALAIYNLEEQQRRERNIINEMKAIWQTSQKDEEWKDNQ
jgi:hypothetical protein